MTLTLDGSTTVDLTAPAVPTVTAEAPTATASLTAPTVPAVQLVVEVEGDVTPPADPDYLAFVAAAEITDPTQQAALLQLVTDLKDAELWTKLDAAYPFVGGNAAAHKWNLLDPRDLDAAFRLTYTGALSHDAGGMTPNGGASAFADTHMVPSAVSQLDSMHLSFYSRTLDGARDRGDMGAYNSPGMNRTHLIIRYTNDATYFGVSETATSFVTNTFTQGLFATSRTGPATTRSYRNGGVVGISASASTSRADIPIYIGELNGFPSGHSNLQCAFASIGDGLDDAEAANLYTIVQAFQAALGRDV